MKDVNSATTLVVRREIAAPAEDLFDAWLDPESLAVFMRPGDIRRTVVKVEPRVGGRFEIEMQGESDTYPHTGSYREIERPRRLVFTWNSRHTQQTDSLVIVEFHATRGGTEIVLTHELLPGEEAVAAHTKGWSAILRLLDETRREERVSV